MLFESPLESLSWCHVPSHDWYGQRFEQTLAKNVLIFGPYVDAFLVFWICTWLDLSGPAMGSITLNGLDFSCINSAHALSKTAYCLAIGHATSVS